MPLSPALRYSPRRETHKRGRSLESGLLIREKEDDLALFNEMQNRERDTFLLQSTTDDLDDALSTKLRYFSNVKLGISIPARGESSELLNAEGDKNDYDWLLTPPDTPLFTSLDDEPPPLNITPRGRPRSQPTSTSRSASTEKSYRNSRGSASPHRLSPSPRSGNSTLQPRGRQLSAPHSSPTHTLRPTTSSRSPSSPSKKPLTPGPRSSSPNPRRASTGSSGSVASTGRRGTSPVTTSRGNSASPKIQAWQSTLPGFSTEAPPNLRTSLADRPASYVRGSSPASRNGRGLSPSSSNGRGLSPASSRGLSPASRKGRESTTKRQSMSPTASRSASSSHSHERDRFSSQSKGSVASSGDDDLDSMQSVSVSITERSAARKIGVFANSRAPTFNKTPSRISSSAPKRSFDSALRQMDRRSPQSMFRPLLSSVPSTTFYVGKASPAHRPMISINSSVTTSSNASSEQGASVLNDNEGSDHEQDGALYPDGQDEIFIFDKVEEVNEVGHDMNDEKRNIVDDVEGTRSEIEPGECETCTRDTSSTAMGTESKSVVDKLSEVRCQENMVICSNCGKKFSVIPHMEDTCDICPDCIQKGECLLVCTSETSLGVVESVTVHPRSALKDDNHFDELNPKKGVPRSKDISSESEIMLAQDETNVEKGEYCLPDLPPAKSMAEEGEQHFMDQQVVGQPIDGSNQVACHSADQQLHRVNAYPSLKVDSSEGVGISLLLNKSGSSKWPVVQGRSFTAANTPSDDLSYARDSTNSMRNSIGYGSVSASSSVDLSSCRQPEARFQRQISSRRADLETVRHDSNMKNLSRGSSFSGTYRANHSVVLDKSTSEENFDASIGHVEFEALEETDVVHDKKVRDTDSECINTSLVRKEVFEEDKLDCTESYRTTGASASELSSCTMSIQLEDTSITAVSNEDDWVSSANAEAPIDNARSTTDIEEPTVNQGSSVIERNAALSNGVSGVDIVDDSPHGSSVMILGEARVVRECSSGSLSDRSLSSDSKSVVDELYEHSLPPTSEKDGSISAPESCVPDDAHSILEESTVTVGDPGGNISKILTLEDATDTIIFCSSIVHSLAYEAATIAMEKENLAPLEGSRQAVTILGKPSSDKKDPRGRNGSKRSPKPHKSRQRRVETNVKPESPKTVADMKSHGSLAHDSVVPNKVDSARPPKLESKCNCTVM